MKWLLILYPLVLLFPTLVWGITVDYSVLSPREEAFVGAVMGDVYAILWLALLTMLIMTRVSMKRAFLRGPTDPDVDVHAWRELCEIVLRRASSGTLRGFAQVHLAYIAYGGGEGERALSMLDQSGWYWCPAFGKAVGERRIKIADKYYWRFDRYRLFLRCRVCLMDGDTSGFMDALQRLRVNVPGSMDLLVPLCLALQTISMEKMPHNLVDSWPAANNVEVLEKYYFQALNELNKNELMKAGQYLLFLSKADASLVFTREARRLLTLQAGGIASRNPPEHSWHDYRFPAKSDDQVELWLRGGRTEVRYIDEQNDGEVRYATDGRGD